MAPIIFLIILLALFVKVATFVESFAASTNEFNFLGIMNLSISVLLIEVVSKCEGVSEVCYLKRFSAS